MSDPIFLAVSHVEIVHEESIARFGGAQGIRDRGLFESAIVQPQHSYFYGGGDLYDVAAAYAFHIAEAQACFDGNKRTGIGAAFLFLELNGIPVEFDSLRLFPAMIAIANKEMDKAEFAGLLRTLCRPDA